MLAENSDYANQKAQKIVYVTFINNPLRTAAEVKLAKGSEMLKRPIKLTMRLEKFLSRDSLALRLVSPCPMISFNF